MTKKILLLLTLCSFTLAAAEYTIPTNNPNVICTIKTEAQDQFEKILEPVHEIFSQTVFDAVHKDLNQHLMIVDVQVKNTLDKPIKLPTVYFKGFEKLLLSKELFAYVYNGLIAQTNQFNATLPLNLINKNALKDIDKSFKSIDRDTTIIFGFGGIIAATIGFLTLLIPKKDNKLSSEELISGIGSLCIAGLFGVFILYNWLLQSPKRSNEFNKMVEKIVEKNAKVINSFAQPATCSNGQIFPPDAPEYVIPPHETFHDHLFIPRDLITKCNFEKTQLITS